jgi:PrgI family protein
MQFRVPQFIDIEDKILGPLTWKQSAYCLGALGSVYISFRLTDSKILGFLFAVVPAGLFLALAFIKINNRNFVDALENAFKFYTKGRLYTWQTKKNMILGQNSVQLEQKSNRLSEISTLLNVKKDIIEDEETLK